MSESFEKVIQAKFADMSPDEFSDWLAIGLRDFYSHPTPDQTPFDFAHPLINRSVSDSLVDDLAYIYEYVIPADRKRLFSAAIATTLDTYASRRSFPSDAVSTLVRLIGEIELDECLYCLPQVVMDGRSGAPSDWLLAESLGVLKQMLASPAALNAIKALVSSSRFVVSYTFDILSELCLASSDRWVEHLKLMSGRLTELFELAQEQGLLQQFEDGQSLFLEDFARYVPIQTFAKHLNLNEMDWIRDDFYEGATRLVRWLLDDARGPFEWRKTSFVDSSGVAHYSVDISWKQDSSIRTTVTFEGKNAFYKELFGEFRPAGEPSAADRIERQIQDIRLERFYGEIGSRGSEA